MSKIDTGGSALPGKVCTGHAAIGEEPIYEHVPGMTLRDWFAGMVLPSVRTSYFDRPQVLQAMCDDNECGPGQLLAMASYQLADQMIAEKRRTEGK